MSDSPCRLLYESRREWGGGAKRHRSSRAGSGLRYRIGVGVNIAFVAAVLTRSATASMPPRARAPPAWKSLPRRSARGGGEWVVFFGGFFLGSGSKAIIGSALCASLRPCFRTGYLFCLRVTRRPRRPFFHSIASPSAAARILRPFMPPHPLQSRIPHSLSLSAHEHASKALRFPRVLFDSPPESSLATPPPPLPATSPYPYLPLP
jgi:hypothetical protein